jgi:hypothetical protein
MYSTLKFFSQKVFLSHQRQESFFYILDKGYLLGKLESSTLGALAKGFHL